MVIIPGMTDLTRPYWAAAREGRLVIQECGECRRLLHPPLPSCPDCHCHGRRLGWREVSGAGTVYSATIVRHATHVALADEIPYVVAIVELAEGPRLVTNITGCPPEDVAVGLPVRAIFRRVNDEIALPCFEPA
ncbi:MAG: Zn-ribbon domain-containing OB-fold protein [Trebonia sp.]